MTMKNLEIWMFPYILLGTLLLSLIVLIIENYAEKFFFGKFTANKPKKSHEFDAARKFCRLMAIFKLFIWLGKHPLWFIPRNRI